MAELLVRMLTAVTLGLALVLLLRRPARQAFGAGAAFTLWLLPLVLALAPLLPEQVAPPAMIVMPELTVTPHIAVAAAAHAAAIDRKQWLLAVWSIGVAVGLLRLAAQYVHLLRGLRKVPAAWMALLAADVPNLDVRRLRVHEAGPAVLWAWPSPLVLLPADFTQRFDNAATRKLVLRHELTHLRRGDAWWSLAMEIASALLWFHPLAWLARPRFRLDQELACDAASLRTLPEQTAGYARALLDGIAVQPVPALISWLAEPQLKERLAMIMRIPPGALRRRCGFLAIAGLLAGGLYVAGARTPLEAATAGFPALTPPSVDVTYKNRNPPRYPVDAIRNGQQGTVMLRIHVNAQGAVTDVAIDHAKTKTSSAELQASAVTAAENWKFNPGIKNGKAVGGWITIPVMFSLGNDVNECPKGQGHSLKPPFKCVPVEPATS